MKDDTRKWETIRDEYPFTLLFTIIAILSLGLPLIGVFWDALFDAAIRLTIWSISIALLASIVAFVAERLLIPSESAKQCARSIVIGFMVVLAGAGILTAICVHDLRVRLAGVWVVCQTVPVLLIFGKRNRGEPSSEPYR